MRFKMSAICFNFAQSNILLSGKGLKASADVEINATQELKMIFIWLENMMGKEENAGYQHFLFPHHVFKWFLSQGC